MKMFIYFYRCCCCCCVSVDNKRDELSTYQREQLRANNTPHHARRKARLVHIQRSKNGSKPKNSSSSQSHTNVASIKINVKTKAIFKNMHAMPARPQKQRRTRKPPQSTPSRRTAYLNYSATHTPDII